MSKLIGKGKPQRRQTCRMIIDKENLRNERLWMMISKETPEEVRVWDTSEATGVLDDDKQGNTPQMVRVWGG